MTIPELKQLEYMPDTGEWYWRDPPKHNSDLKDCIAGYLRSNGRRVIRINRVGYLASRLAFVWMLGRWPYDEVDHIDRNQSNDRWDNLREASSSDNKYNRDLGFRGGYRGVYHSGEATWSAAVGNTYLGVYASLTEAVSAREEALVRAGKESFAYTDENLL
jgi:hypothetical protein